MNGRFEIPECITILGEQFVVKVGPVADGDCGNSNEPLRLIEIDPSFPQSTQWETFYHEVVHMALTHTGITELLTDKQEEAICQTLGAALSTLKFTYKENE